MSLIDLYFPTSTSSNYLHLSHIYNKYSTWIFNEET